MTSTAAEIKLRSQLRELQRYEEDHDLVPGTASLRNEQPTGGVSWEGAAWCAAARRSAGVELTERDVEALRRYPSPRSSFG